MNAVEYLTNVVEKIATHGNRGNQDFIKAFTIANHTLNNYPHLLADDTLRARAEECKNLISAGLQTYVPGREYFEPVVAVEYATLVANFNSIVALATELA